MPASPRGEAFDSLHRAKAFPSRGDSPLCWVSPRKKYACGIFQGEWDNRRRQTTIKMASGADKRVGRLSELPAIRQTPICRHGTAGGKAPALRRTCGSIPFRSNEKGLPGLNRKSFSFVKREKEMKMRGFANGVPLWNIFIIPAN